MRREDDNLILFIKMFLRYAFHTESEITIAYAYNISCIVWRGPYSTLHYASVNTEIDADTVSDIYDEVDSYLYRQQTTTSFILGCFCITLTV